MKEEVISKSTIIPNVWNGGKTYEYFIYPTDSSYANRDFDFRISCASIEKVPSTFTKFNGYKRYLVMLDNELTINRNNKEEKYSKNELFEFDSDDSIQSFSLGNDFNVMFKKKSHPIDLIISRFDGNYQQKFLFAFALHETEIKMNKQVVILKKDDLLILTNEENQLITCTSNHELIIGLL